MNKPIIEVQNLSKLYQLGTVGATTIRESFDRWWCKVSGKEYYVHPVGHKPLMVDPNDPQSGFEPNTMWALKDASFSVNQGEIVGVIGRNGAGKSTLLKILSKITEPTSGKAILRGRVSSLLEVGTGFHPELTGRENIYLNGAILGMRKAEIENKFDEIVTFAEVEKFIDTPVKHYSSGMYVRLAFAVAAHLEPEILIVDEVLAVGDASFQKKCLGKMGDIAKQGRTVLFVSHNMGAIQNLCHTGIVLGNGKIIFSGISSQAIEFYNLSILGDRVACKELPPHVIYSESTTSRSNNQSIRVTHIEVLDKNGAPKPLTATWDDVVFRIWYYVNNRIERGSVVLELTSFDGRKLLLLSTQPDSTLPLVLEPGSHAVDCRIQQFPFAAGDYIVGAGLAIPGAEWLWREPELSMITVVPCDVYGSGLAPIASRALIAVKHQWQVAHD